MFEVGEVVYAGKPGRQKKTIFGEISEFIEDDHGEIEFAVIVFRHPEDYDEGLVNLGIEYYDEEEGTETEIRVPVDQLFTIDWNEEDDWDPPFNNRQRIYYEKGLEFFQTAMGDRDSDYPTYQFMKRSKTIEAGKCYFCGRTEKEWEAIQKKILDSLRKEQSVAGSKSSTRKEEIDSGFESFKSIWSEVNNRHKISTLMSDPNEFLPEEINKYWNEDWDHGASLSESRHGDPFSDYFVDYRESNPEWFSLERLCLGWLFEYHTDYHSAVAMRTREEKKNKDVRVSKIEKKMLKEIKNIWRENLGKSTRRGGYEGASVDEQNQANQILAKKLIALQDANRMRTFTWKPFTDDEIAGKSLGTWRSDSRSDLFSISMKICPVCHDRFQSNEGE